MPHDLVLDERAELGRVAEELADLLEQRRNGQVEDDDEADDEDRVDEEDREESRQAHPAEALHGRVEEVDEQEADDERADGVAAQPQEHRDHGRGDDDEGHSWRRRPEARVVGAPYGGWRRRARLGARVGVLHHRSGRLPDVASSTLTG